MIPARVKWLDEIVCWDSSEYLPRYTAIWRLVSQGLYPFLIRNGYRLTGDVRTFSSSIATLLFTNRGRSCLDLETVRTTSYEVEAEDKDHYYHVLPQTRWDEFWETWAVWCDLNDFRGEDRRIDIQEHCWSQLNLEESPQTHILDDLLTYPEDIAILSKEDVYLREAAESNEWGGFR